MAWIRVITREAASGRLRQLYDQAVERAGKVFNVLEVQGVRPETLAASTNLYAEVMLSTKSPLSRVQREMIATTVSQINHCHY